MLRDTVEHKLDHYEKIIKKLERKYGVSFGDFSKKLEREATINMLGAWRKTGESHSYPI